MKTYRIHFLGDWFKNALGIPERKPSFVLEFSSLDSVPVPDRYQFQHMERDNIPVTTSGSIVWAIDNRSVTA